MTGNFNIVNGKQVTHYAGLFALSARDGRRREQLAAFLQRQWPIDQSERLYFARSCKCLEEWEARFQQLALEIDKFRLISIEHNLRFSFFFLGREWIYGSSTLIAFLPTEMAAIITKTSLPNMSSTKVTLRPLSASSASIDRLLHTTSVAIDIGYVTISSGDEKPSSDGRTNPTRCFSS